MNATETKTCPHCQQVRPLDQFALRNKGTEKRQSWCRPCIRDTRRANREEARRVAA